MTTAARPRATPPAPLPAASAVPAPPPPPGRAPQAPPVPATRLLVVEDDARLARALLLNLRARDYEADAAPDGATALRTARVRRPDVVLLDLGLTDMDGVDVIRALRGWTGVPVLVLSARHASGEKVAALDAGADDYITKPFSMDELLARVRAAVRRTEGAAPAAEVSRVETDTFTVDLSARRTVRDGQEVRLTPTEWHLLEILVTSPGRLVTQRHLLHEVWGTSQRGRSNYLRVYMARLRRKLEADPSHPRYLITEPGMGYRFEG
ncbi:response regulator [Streptomyces sp. SID8352]|nr:response regulator [Streptomyces sp. SID8352]